MQRNAELERVAKIFLGAWTMSRADPDFHQQLVGRIEGDRMVGQADASEDGGVTWRKDYDLVFERARGAPQ